MLKLTESQLLFLNQAIEKAEEEQMIGYPESNGQPSKRDKEILGLVDFFKSLKEGHSIIKEEI